MTEEDKTKPSESAQSGPPRGKLSGHFELDLPKAEKATDQPDEQKKSFAARLKNDLREPRFWLELAALIVVAVYTYEAREANKLTRVVLNGTDVARVLCNGGGSFGGTQDKVSTGSYVVDCQNVGNLTAEDVSGSITVSIDTFPERRRLHVHQYPFGGKGRFIDSGQLRETEFPFPVEDVSIKDDLAQISAHKEIVVIDGSVNYFDGISSSPTRPFCYAFANWDVIGDGTASTNWEPCDRLKPLAANVRRRNKQENGTQRK